MSFRYIPMASLFGFPLILSQRSYSTSLMLWLWYFRLSKLYTAYERRSFLSISFFLFSLGNAFLSVRSFISWMEPIIVIKNISKRVAERRRNIPSENQLLSGRITRGVLERSICVTDFFLCCNAKVHAGISPWFKIGQREPTTWTAGHMTHLKRYHLPVPLKGSVSWLRMTTLQRNAFPYLESWTLVL